MRLTNLATALALSCLFVACGGPYVPKDGDVSLLVSVTRESSHPRKVLEYKDSRADTNWSQLAFKPCSGGYCGRITYTKNWNTGSRRYEFNGGYLQDAEMTVTVERHEGGDWRTVTLAKIEPIEGEYNTYFTVNFNGALIDARKPATFGDSFRASAEHFSIPTYGPLPETVAVYITVYYNDESTQVYVLNSSGTEVRVLQSVERQYCALQTSVTAPTRVTRQYHTYHSTTLPYEGEVQTITWSEPVEIWVQADANCTMNNKPDWWCCEASQ